MSIKSFKEFHEELKNINFKPLIPNAFGSNDFDIWLHSNKNPFIKHAKQCKNRNKLYKKLKKLGRKM